MRRLLLFPIVVLLCTILMCIDISCSGNKEATKGTSKSPMQLPDTLRVATLYSPLSYFLYRGDTLGYDYTLISDFAHDKKLKLDIVVAPSLDRAVELLDSGIVDVIAYGVPVTSEYKKTVYPCGPENFTSQVLVQRIGEDSTLISDVTELVGRDVWVEPNSKYQQRLENLNIELGGGINIHIIDRDTIIDEDVIEMVSNQEIPLSIVASDIAKLNKTYFDNIDVSLEISFRQRSSWGVSPKNAWLGDSISQWFESEGTRRENENLLKRYFELSKKSPLHDFAKSMGKGPISPYDSLFRVHAERIGWDWRLMAAQGYVESQFNNDVVSWAGARGLMQIMPSTARAYDVDPNTLEDPAISISLAADVIKATEDMLVKHVEDPKERLKFTVAAYNSGIGHIIDAIALAKKYNKNPKIWFGNVEEALLMKGDKRYYNDPVVKYGYFRGKQTTQYVRDVYQFYENISKTNK